MSLSARSGAAQEEGGEMAITLNKKIANLMEDKVQLMEDKVKTLKENNA